ncbi:hypothetical protein [Butyrivibrio proteoclasticus]|uniref:hypothetical protein n=1 Tax=Butyrivibrio proteoclasticus TaxID=43305 RepID=UPI00047CAFC2|nr:hypothetical protein [Butyrivibrio proteoclasticus]
MFEVLLFISFEILVSMFAMLFELFPGTKYKIYKHVIQLYMNIAMLVLLGIDALMCVFDGENLRNINIFAEKEMLELMAFLYGLFMFCSIYKYVDMKKNSGQIEIIELKAGQYHIERPIESTGKHLSVKRLAICDGFTIIFSSVMPSGDGDVRLVCKRIDDTNYECLTMEEDVDFLEPAAFIAKIGSYLLYILYSLTAAFIVLTCHYTNDVELSTFYSDMLGSVFILAFGISLIKLFKGTKGCSKFFFLIFAGLMVFLASFKLLNTIVMFLV